MKLEFSGSTSSIEMERISLTTLRATSGQQRAVLKARESREGRRERGRPPKRLEGGGLSDVRVWGGEGVSVGGWGGGGLEFVLFWFGWGGCCLLLLLGDTTTAEGFLG